LGRESSSALDCRMLSSRSPRTGGMPPRSELSMHACLTAPSKRWLAVCVSTPAVSSLVSARARSSFWAAKPGALTRAAILGRSSMALAWP
jgi:hypothetical protein